MRQLRGSHARVCSTVVTLVLAASASADDDAIRRDQATGLRRCWWQVVPSVGSTGVVCQVHP